MKHILTVANGEHPIILEMYSTKKKEEADPRFKVTYGLEIHKNLKYYDAARTFGFCYFHMLACEAKFEQDD